MTNLRLIGAVFAGIAMASLQSPADAAASKAVAFLQGQSNAVLLADNGAGTGAYWWSVTPGMLHDLTGIAATNTLGNVFDDPNGGTTMYSGTPTYGTSGDRDGYNPNLWLNANSGDANSWPLGYQGNNCATYIRNNTSGLASDVPIAFFRYHSEYDSRKTGTDLSYYAAANHNFVGKMRAAASRSAAQMPIFYGSPAFGYTSFEGLGAVRAAWLAEINDANQNAHWAFGNSFDCTDLNGDWSHEDNNGCKQVAARFAIRYARYLYDNGYAANDLSQLPKLGPRVDRVDRGPNANQVDLHIQHDKGNDIVVPSSFRLDSFSLYDPGTGQSQQPNNASRVNSTTVRLTFNNNLSGNGGITLDYCYNSIFYGPGNLIRDNWNSLSKPAVIQNAINNWFPGLTMPLQRFERPITVGAGTDAGSRDQQGGGSPPPPPPATESPYPGPNAAAIPGTIQAENYDNGGEGLAYHDTDGGNTGGQYRGDGVDIEGCTDTGGGYNVGWTNGGEYLKFMVNIAAAGSYNVVFRVANGATANGSFHLENNTGNNLSGALSIAPTGGWQTWANVTATVNLPAGNQTLKFVEDSANFNINYISFSAVPVAEAPYGGARANLPGTLQAENYDTGGEGVAYHDIDAGNSGGAYRSDNVDISAATDTGNGNCVGWIAGGEWLKYMVNVTTAGNYNLTLRIAGMSAGSLHIEDENGANRTGAVSIPSTGGWQTWSNVSATVSNLTAGNHTLKVVFDTAGYNLNWISFATSGGTTVPAAPTNVTATAGNAQIVLTWTAASGATGYQIYRGTAAGQEGGAVYATATGTTWTNTGLTNGTAYFYRMKSVNSAGTSAAYSNEASATPTAPTGTGPANGTYVIIPACANGARLDASNASTANGTNVQIWASNGSTAQKWIVTNTTGSTYKIATANNASVVIDVDSAFTFNGANVQLFSDLSGANQRWNVVSLGSGKYKLNPTHATGMALDVSGGGSANGTNVQIWADNAASNAAQQWSFAAGP